MVSEYVIRGNAAILKCTIPSFVAEFVSVASWEGSDGSSYEATHDYGTPPKLTRATCFLIIQLHLFNFKLPFRRSIAVLQYCYIEKNVK